jgi:hypothetical protein
MEEMEKRSSQCIRTLLARSAGRGMGAYQIGCARISMMARSTERSNQRPDTLVQDRRFYFDHPSCDARPDHTFVSSAGAGFLNPNVQGFRSLRSSYGDM